jgi:SAM-dependent MidA family methyltransferase
MLGKIVTEKIEKDGPIPFREFMELALYYPEHGYYTSEHTDLGRMGDFYTSSHVHPVFGACIGKQIEEMWKAIDTPEEFYLIEIGAGKGYLAADMLKYLQGKSFSDAVRYVIVEINPCMQQKQQGILAPYQDKIKWVRTLNEIRSVQGCIVNNELLDSFPVHLVQTERDTLKEIYVSIQDDEFQEILCESRSELLDYLKEFKITLPDDYRTEFNLMIKDWLRDVAVVLDEGFLFTIDYGYPSGEYYRPERNRGTLLCYYKHQINERPFEHIGAQDITAHVNFSALKKWGEDVGFVAVGYCRQGTFLVSLRIENVLSEMKAEQGEAVAGYGRVSTLLSPEGMGDSHKVMIQYKGRRKPQLLGFSLRNRVDLL